MKNWTLDMLFNVAKEMYSHGTFYSERYSQKEWDSFGWPQVDDSKIYEMLDHNIKLLRTFDVYQGKESDTDGRRISKIPYGRGVGKH